MMPQWDFLDFLRDRAAAYPGFRLEMEQPVESFIEEKGRITGVKLAGGKTLKASWLSPPMAAIPLPAPCCRSKTSARRWMSSGSASPSRRRRGRAARQCRAGASAGDDRPRRLLAVRLPHPQGRGPALSGPRHRSDQGEVAKAAPPGLDLKELDDIADLHLLTVKLDRLECWHRPGLLAIGDAAHAMSPIGGIGINLAIQDAVAAANILAAPLRRGDDVNLASPGPGSPHVADQGHPGRAEGGAGQIIGRMLQAGQADHRGAALRQAA